jgi:hypothetical protein
MNHAAFPVRKIGRMTVFDTCIQNGVIHDTGDIMRFMKGFVDSIKGVSLWPVLSRNMVAAV